jgi:hypothetical protein
MIVQEGMHSVPELSRRWVFDGQRRCKRGQQRFVEEVFRSDGSEPWISYQGGELIVLRRFSYRQKT